MCQSSVGSCSVSWSYVDNNAETVSLSFTVPQNGTTIPSFVVTGGGFGGATVISSGPTAADKGATADALLTSLASFGSSFFDDGDIVTDGDIAGPGGTPFQFNAVAAGQAAGEDTVLAYAGTSAEALKPVDSSFDFRFDLLQMARRLARGSEALGVAGAPATAGEDDAAPRWFVPWITGRYTDFSDGSAVDRDGGLWAINAGVTLRLDKDIHAGVFGRYRQGTVSSTALSSSLDSRFWGGGAFVQLGKGDDLKLTLGGLVERGQNDITTSGASGHFDSVQWTVNGRVEKRFVSGSAWLLPSLSVVYAGLNRDGYTDSGSTAVAGSSQTLGRLNYGSRIGTSVPLGGGQIVQTYAELQGHWTFDKADDTTLTGGQVLTSETNSVSLGGGLEYVALSGVTVRARGDWFVAVDGDFFKSFDLSNRLTGWSVSGGIGLPLAAVFGSGATGTMNFDMTGSASSAGAHARLAVPLH